MKKIALATCYFHPNYGSELQAYATQRIFEAWEIPCETIRIDGFQRELDAEKVKFYLRRAWDPQVFTGTIGRIGRKKLQAVLHRKDFGGKLAVRQKKFTEFQRRHFHLSPLYRSREELTDACGGYSSVVVGSDQLWLPSNIAADYYTLSWVPDEVNKVSYATSFGTSCLPAPIQKKAKAFLPRIQHLSVREQSAVAMIRQYTGRSAALVCDPTMLFDAEEWLEIQPVEPMVSGNYILCYFLGNNKKDRAFAQRLRDITGYKIVALLHLDEYIAADEGYADEAPYDVGPGELLNLIRHARYVVTDSFHGSVFSLLYRKTFFTSRRVAKEGLLCTNSRLDSLFDTLGVTGRLITGDEPVEECLKRKIDFDTVHRKIQAFRISSMAFLREAVQ